MYPVFKLTFNDSTYTDGDQIELSVGMDAVMRKTQMKKERIRSDLTVKDEVERGSMKDQEESNLQKDEGLEDEDSEWL